MKGTMSILGLYNYDNTIFDNMVLPEGVIKQTVIDNILMEFCENEVLYPNPVVMKSVIELWSKKELNVWQKLYETTQFDYNPIWNKDGTETWTNTETRNLHNSGTITRNLQNGNTETRNLEINANNSGTDITQNYVNAYNSSSDSPSGKNTVTLGTGNNTKNTGTVVNGGTDTGTVGNDAHDTGTVTHVYSQKAQGNIGVTTTQQMIKEEREVDKFNIYDYIINSFKKRFCLLVY